MFIEGHIIVKREIKEWGWYHDPKMFSLFVHMLIDANFKDGEWEGHTIKRGQLVTSMQMLSVDTGLSLQEVRTCMRKLGGAGEVRSTSVGRRSIITICNYEDYQDCQHGINTESTRSQHSSNTEPTGEQHAIIEKGNKEIKEEKKSPSGDGAASKRFVRPTADEVAAYCDQNNYPIDAQSFVDYYESKGWKVGNSPMKSWQAAVRTWVRRRKEEGGLFQTTQRQEPQPAPAPVRELTYRDYLKDNPRMYGESDSDYELRLQVQERNMRNEGRWKYGDKK